MKILITGASGLIGTAFQQYLGDEKHEIATLERNTSTTTQPYWDIHRGHIDFAGFEPDSVIHLVGENIASGRWTEKRKARILNSRVDGTRLLVNHLVAMQTRPLVLLSGSAIGFYGLRNAELLDEDSPAGKGFVTDICIPWEKETQPAKSAGIRVINMRTGVVMSDKGGALSKMLPAFKLGLGGKIGDGKQYMSWVDIEDMVRMMEFCMLTDKLEGPVNMTAPNPVTNTEFSKALGKALRRPVLFPMPALAAKIMFGEMAEELLLGGARVIPKKLVNAGYSFRYPRIDDSLARLVRKTDRLKPQHP